MILTNWNFALDNPSLRQKFILSGVNGKKVTVPHTWNVSPETETYSGVAWYSTALKIDEIKDINILHFESVFHDAEVFLNGNSICRHSMSGYTPFEVDITKSLKIGDNLITVKCDNSFSADLLPHKKDYDWSNDGGIIREVSFLQKDFSAVKSCKITSDITDYLQNGNGNAAVTTQIEFYKAMPQEVDIQISDKDSEIVFKKSIEAQNDKIELKAELKNAKLWNTENPEMYTLSVNGEQYKFGIREIKVKGEKILLNGKEIRLIGVEWMPGSHPDFGMAEPQEVSYKFLQYLKDINCNFTRFHWQQADFVYDWCDEHGLMVQEEIPYWGSPKASADEQVQIAKQQADEMFAAHKNHPSIVCWGVGNELNGRSFKTIKYVKELVSYFKSLDKTRLVNYVSNTMGKHGLIWRDATAYGDICMWNEYMGTWYGKCDYEKEMKFACSQAHGKPFMVTEFGLCEPHFDGGDERRTQIYKEKTALYNKFNLNGWVYFSLNDYRTHCGESGEGRLRSRIHGSTDLYGEIKPLSFGFIKEQNKIDLHL